MSEVDGRQLLITGVIEESPRTNPFVSDKTLQRIDLHPEGLLFSPQESLALITALLASLACIAPWFAGGWSWFGMIAFIVALVVCYDALSLWLSRQEYVPILLQPEKGLRGTEGKTIQISFAIIASARTTSHSDIRVAIMPATKESEIALQIKSDPARMRLEQPDPSRSEPALTNKTHMQLWPWTADIALLRRGLWSGPRVGIERQSRLRIWRLRRWFTVPTPLRIDANLRAGRQQILRSPVYRMLVAAQQTPWTGHGREFERLREYQPGDTYSEIAWKSTARRGVPVTRLFQWEQKQEVYFVVDQSRLSGLGGRSATGSVQKEGARQRMLDLAVETALVGATVALELGDDFGLVTYADGAKSWLRAGSGQAQFHRFRDLLLNIEPLPTTADYEALFADIRLRLRRRAYLVLLADLTERSISDSLLCGVGMVRSTHALLMTSILPVHVRSAFSPNEVLNTDQDVYTALAGDRENQRLMALSRRMRQVNVQLRYVPAEKFLRTAVEGYLENKREQRL